MGVYDPNHSGVNANGLSDVDDFNDRMSQPIGSVTSRDDIIDPYSLVNPANYRNNRRGQAQYQSDLQQAIQYAERQEAAYQEWYNSPAQQAIRDRQAGLNPDLLGLSDSEASDTQPSATSPIEGQVSNDQLALDGIDSAMQIFNTISSVASVCSAIPNIGKQGQLLDAQKDAQVIANVAAFEQIAHNAISSNFATYHAAETAAGRAVDVAAYFANDANFSDIIPSYAPSDSPMYQHALSRVRKGSESILASAYSTNQQVAQGHQSFAKLLANPYANSNTLVMSACLEPLMSAVFDAEKEELEFQKLVREKKKQYMSSIDASEAGDIFMSELRQMQIKRNHDNIISQAKSRVFDNLRSIYERDGFNSSAGFQACALILGHFESTLESLIVSWIKGRTLDDEPFVPTPEAEKAVESASEYIERMQNDGFLLVD